MEFTPINTKVLHSNRMHYQAKKRMNKHSHGKFFTCVKDRTVVVFDWDDTLCPSSWLHAQELLPKYRGQKIPMNREQMEMLQIIEAHVVRLLEKALSYGPCFVVTAAEYGWIELSASLFLPRVYKLLEQHRDLHIVSARTWYEQMFGVGQGDSSSWKYEVMQLIARKCFTPTSIKGIKTTDGEIYFNFVSIGDSIAERDACHSAVDKNPFTFAKTLKFVEHPTSNEIAQQVELAFDSFDQMCGWTSNLDLTLTRSQLAQLRCIGE